MTGTTKSVRLKPIALPAEHGSWGFLLEPIVLGLALAPTWPGLALALAVAAAFLIRNPLRIFLRARNRLRESPRFAVARRVAIAYGAIAVAGVAVCALLAGMRPLWPLAGVSPLALLFVRYDSANQGRALVAEMVGPVGLAAAAPALVLAGRWPTDLALAVWAVLVLKGLPTVVYIRARLRLEDGGRVRTLPSVTIHAAAVAVAVVLWRGGLAPSSTLIALVVLGLRAAIGLTPARWGRTPKQIGILEFVFSGLYVIATAVGYRAAG